MTIRHTMRVGARPPLHLDDNCKRSACACLAAGPDGPDLIVLLYRPRLFDQGGCMALEDSLELANAIGQAAAEAAAAGGGSAGPLLEAALRRYEASRAPRVARVNEQSLQVGHSIARKRMEALQHMYAYVQPQCVARVSKQSLQARCGRIEGGGLVSLLGTVRPVAMRLPCLTEWMLPLALQIHELAMAESDTTVGG